jgi:hypothetical protein
MIDYCKLYENSINKNDSVLKTRLVGMPSLQLYAGVSSFEAISPASKSGQNWRLKVFPLVLPLVFRLKASTFCKKNFNKILCIFEIMNFLNIVVNYFTPCTNTEKCINI